MASNSNNRGWLLMAQAYHPLAWGLTQLPAYVQEEPHTQHRYCNSAVIVQLVALASCIFQPSVLNLHDPAQRWRKRVGLRIAQDQWKPYGQTQHAFTARNHTGAHKRSRKVPAPNVAGDHRIHDDEVTVSCHGMRMTSKCHYNTVLLTKITVNIADFPVHKSIDHEVSHQSITAPRWEQQFAIIAAPLTTTLKINAVWNWIPAHQRLKDELLHHNSVS